MTDRLLVMRGGALGDFILGLPALQALRRRFPGAALELVAPSAVLPLASHLVDVATPLERAEVATLFGDPELMPEQVASRYRGLGLVVLWLADADGALRRLFEMLGARRLLHAPALPPGAGRHAADHLMDTLRPLGVPRGPAVPALRLSEAALRRAVELLPPCRPSVAPPSGGQAPAPPGGGSPVAIHPGSGGGWKCWPAERFARVAQQLAGLGLPVLLIQGPADQEPIRRVLAEVRGERPPVVAGLGVEELAALLSLCGCYLGNDSGVTHLAAAAGTPAVALFGPTDPAVWGPRGRRVVLPRAETECAPCSREAAAGCRTRACLEGLGVEQVVVAVRALVRPRRGP